SRLILGDSSYAASQWIFDTYASWGYEARFDSFYIPEAVMGDWPGIGWERNVIAPKEGTSGADARLVIGGHFDSIVWSDTAVARIDAPGADDNATGIAGAMEAARVLRDFPMEKDVDFAGWGAEEIGLIGSVVYAFTADQQGDAIEGMINMDMIGYMDDSRLDCIIQYAASPALWFAELYRQASQTYVPSLTVTPTIASGGSDWYPFAYVGYPAVGAAEQDRTNFNPHYHDPSDRIETLTPELYTAITKASLATLVILGVCPGPVLDVRAQDMGDGETVLVQWSPSGEPDIAGYWAWWGVTSQTYTDSALISGAASASYLLSGLTADTPYYFVVRAMDTEGHQSYRATEVVTVPREVPQAPSGVAATPIAGGIRIDWFPNGEADIAGYRVHRRINAGDYDLLADLLPDTSFVDPGLSGANQYYYRVEAVDGAGHVSAPSDNAYGRPMTLDQGILVVDETRNYTSPPDSVQDAFYRAALEGFRFTEFEYGSPAEAPVLSDFAPYSTVLWHADDFAQFLAAGHVPELEAYLDAGGNLWFTGWKATADLSGSSTYPMTFEAGSFMYDYMGVERVELSGMADSLVGVTGEGGYPDLTVDPAAIPTPAWGSTLRYVESWTPVPSAEVVYRADMTDDGSAFDGAVCGVRRLNDSPRVVFFGFPLSFMEPDGARQVARIVLAALGEPLEADDSPVIVATLQVEASPNPFRGTTTISFVIPEAGAVQVRLFDMAGHLVVTLVDERVAAGSHVVTWDGTDAAGSPVGSGAYLCRFEAPGGQSIRRLLLVR
ncbi:MAG: M20/M25/M40 family metallo-hydrolase, partial [Candidatus Eisenbacteria bacterium]|nr:M20/M25/M40 family metallo-hydrolase [Candidatus Eisenbacteria bacterium]